MTMLSTNFLGQNHFQTTRKPVGILRGLGHAGDPLHWIGTIMLEATPRDQRRWIIDNRAARDPLALVELARFANLVRSNPGEFSDVAIAWVGESPMSNCLRTILKSLPLRFCEFDSFDTAYFWLHEEV